MTEPMFFASLFGLLYFTVRFRETRGWGALLGASLAAFAGTLTRYEAWFLLPFVAVYLCINARGKARSRAARSFSASSPALGPALWLAHNRWYYGDPLYFYRGPYSAAAHSGKDDLSGQGRLAHGGAIFFDGGASCRGMAGADPRSRRHAGRSRAAGRLALLFLVASRCFLCLGDSFVGRSDLRSGVVAAHLVQHALRAGLSSAVRDRARRRSPGNSRGKPLAVAIVACRAVAVPHPSFGASDHLAGIGRQLARAARMDRADGGIPGDVRRSEPDVPHQLRRTHADLPHSRHPASRHSDRR